MITVLDTVWMTRKRSPELLRGYAHQSNHTVKSVERYLKDYERVRTLLKQNLDAASISAIIGRGVSVVQEYIAQARVYHPDLFDDVLPRS